MHLSSTPYMRGTFPAMRSRPPMKWAGQRPVVVSGEADDAAFFAVVDVHGEPWNRMQGWYRGHIISAHPTEMVFSDRRQRM